MCDALFVVCVAVYGSMLKCVAMGSGSLEGVRVAETCVFSSACVTMLQCVAVCCSVLQCVAVCCRVLY